MTEQGDRSATARAAAARAAGRLGERVYAMVQELGAIFTLFLQFLSWVPRPPSEVRSILKQMEVLYFD